MSSKPVDITFVTTLGVDVGDEFTREGVCSFMDEVFEDWRPFFVNKHDQTSLHTRVADETALLADKFLEADMIVHAGAPVYWKIGDNTSCNVEWAEELWFKRIFRLGIEKPVLNIAASACQPYPDTARTFLADPDCVSFADRVAAACCWTTVCDPIAAQILHALGHKHMALPCAAFHAARRFKQPITPEKVVGINLMPMQGDSRSREDVWRATLAAFLEGARKRHRLLFIAHDRREVEYMEKVRAGDERVFFSGNFRDYLPVYGQCQAVVANRVHGAVCAAGFGNPALIIGNDTRLMIGDFIGLPARYVGDVTSDGLLDLLNTAVTHRTAERERLLALRESSARFYVDALKQVFAGTKLAGAVKSPPPAVRARQAGPDCQTLRTLSSFALRLGLQAPDQGMADALDSLLASPDSRELVRHGGAVLVVAEPDHPVGWYLAALGASVTVARPASGSGRISSSEKSGCKLRVVDGFEKTLPLGPQSFDLVVVLSGNFHDPTEVMRLLRPGGMALMPATGGAGQAAAPGSLDRKHWDPAPDARLLIPRFDTFGDIVLFEGFLAALRAKLPEAELCLLVRKGYEELAGLFPSSLNLQWRTVDFPAYIAPTDEQKEHLHAALVELSATRWDAVMLTAFNRTWLDRGVLRHFDGVQKIMVGSGADTAALAGERCSVVPVPEWSHETEKYRLLLERLFGTPMLSAPRLEISQALARQARGELASLSLEGARYVACLPAGTNNQKIKVWPLERYSAVLDWLAMEHGMTPLIIGHEREAVAVRSLAGMLAARGIPAVSWLGGEGGIPMLAALLQQASLFLGNDSGPMHIAAAVGTPVIGVFGGGTAPRFFPCGKQSLSVIASLPCFGCYWDCVFGDAPCLQLVDVETVKEAIRRVLGGKPLEARVLDVGAALPESLVEMAGKARNARLKRDRQWRELLRIAQDEAAAMRSSPSWKVTKPLRSVMKRLKR